MFLGDHHETETPATNKRPSSGRRPAASRPQSRPTAGQLWNVIEFSRQFPELTLFLVADSKAAELRAKQLRRSAPDEPLEFPPLVAPDPKELHSQAQKRQEEQEQLADAVSLFAEGKLPPPEQPPALPPQKEKMQIWRYLMTFFAMLLLALFWLQSSGQEQLDAAAAAGLRLQASR